MTDRGRFWPGRRVLVLGCTGFLGCWAVRALLARGAEVVGLVRHPKPDSDLFRDKLYQRLHIVRGRADDVHRLRTLIAVYETQLVVQCAADPDGSAEAYTRTAVAAAGAVPVLAPVPLRLTVHPRPTSCGLANVTIVRLPTLFGGGDRRWDRWPPRLLLSAAHGEPLPPPPADQVGAPVVSVRDAIDGMLDTMLESPSETTSLRTVDVPPKGTAADLFAAVSRLTAGGPRLLDAPAARNGLHFDETVQEAINWYRTAVPLGDRPGLLPPVTKAAA